MIADKYKKILQERDGVFHLIKTLENDFSPERLITRPENQENQKLWQAIGLGLKDTNRPLEGIEVFLSLYKKMLQWEIEEKKWTHKAMPLVWISDIFRGIGYKSIAKRFMMLTMIDDSIRDLSDAGELLIDKGGTYFRLRYYFGMGHEEILRYCETAYHIFKKNKEFGLFPEYILQLMDNEWMIETPSTGELSHYVINPVYVEQLQNGLGMSLVTKSVPRIITKSVPLNQN